MKRNHVWIIEFKLLQDKDWHPMVDYVSNTRKEARAEANWFRHEYLHTNRQANYRAVKYVSVKRQSHCKVECGKKEEIKMKILSLDLATKTGWCTEAQSGVQTFDVKRGESPGMRFLRCRAWLNEIYSLVPGLSVICYEQAHHRGGAATQCGVGLVTVVLEFAAKNDLETMPIHSATLKKWATGNGRAGKPDMIKAAIRMGYKPIDDNEADACLLYEYAKENLT